MQCDLQLFDWILELPCLLLLLLWPLNANGL